MTMVSPSCSCLQPLPCQQMKTHNINVREAGGHHMAETVRPRLALAKSLSSKYGVYTWILFFHTKPGGDACTSKEPYHFFGGLLFVGFGSRDTFLCIWFCACPIKLLDPKTLFPGHVVFPSSMFPIHPEEKPGKVEVSKPSPCKTKNMKVSRFRSRKISTLPCEFPLIFSSAFSIFSSGLGPY